MDGTAVYNMVSSIFDAMTTQVQDDVDAGKYDTLGIPGVQADPSSYIYSGTKLNCSLGMAPRLNTFTCGQFKFRKKVVRLTLFEKYPF
jgi:hypothetical protein